MYFYDYAGQDPINNYDLDGTAFIADGENSPSRARVNELVREQAARKGPSVGHELETVGKVAVIYAGPSVAGAVAGIAGTAICGPGCGIIAAGLARGAATTLVSHYVADDPWSASIRRGEIGAVTAGTEQAATVYAPWLVPTTYLTGKPANVSQAQWATAVTLWWRAHNT